MQVLPFSEESLADAIAVMRSGGVVAHATETCYGFACDIANVKAVEKLFAIKQRPTSQPVSALFASLDDAKEFVEWNKRADELAAEYLPGPLTLILPMKKGVSLFSIPNPNPNPTIGVRISSSPDAQILVEKFGSPISTTSANLHGQPNPYSADDIMQQFKDAPHQADLILDSGMLPQVPPSTVINLVKEEGEMETLRQGLLKM